MKFEIDKATTLPPASVRVGDVFRAKASGPKGRAGTKYWLVAAITESQFGGAVHHLLGLDITGSIVSTSSYGGWVMADRDRVGHCPGFGELNLQVVQETQP